MQHQTLLAYAGWPEDNPIEENLDRMADLLQDVTFELVAAAWVTARRDHLYRSAANNLVAVADKFNRWVGDQVLAAQEDPVE